MPNERPRIYGTAFLFRKNLILSEALIAAPTAACADTIAHALMLCFVFACVSGLTILLSSFFPRRMPYAFRILSYSLIAALVYIPTKLAADFLFADTDAAGLYLPLLSFGILLTAQHDQLFRAERLSKMLGRLICAIAGACAVILLMGVLRELFGAGTLYGYMIFSVPPLPAMLTPAFGMVMLACFCALAQAICQTERKEAADDSDR